MSHLATWQCSSKTVRLGTSGYRVLGRMFRNFFAVSGERAIWCSVFSMCGVEEFALNNDTNAIKIRAELRIAFIKLSGMSFVN